MIRTASILAAWSLLAMVGTPMACSSSSSPRGAAARAAQGVTPTLRVITPPKMQQITASEVVGIVGNYTGCAASPDFTQWVLDTAENPNYMEDQTGIPTLSVDLNDTNCTLTVTGIATSSPFQVYVSEDAPSGIPVAGPDTSPSVFEGVDGFDQGDGGADGGVFEFYANAYSSVVDATGAMAITVALGDGPNVGTSSTTGSSVACFGDLSDIANGDFQISFTIETTQADAEIAVLNQRSICGPGNFWDVRIQGGTIRVETDSLTDAAPDDDGFAGCTQVTDGQTHAVVIQRIAGFLSLYVDAALDTSGPSTASFGALPPLSTGSDVCVGVDETVAFDTSQGNIANVCIAPGSPTPLEVGTSACN